MDKYYIRIEISETPKRKLPKGGNARQHWKTKFNEVSKWKKAMIEAIGDKIPKDPLKQARLKFKRCSARANNMDWDNLVISFKSVQDALVEALILENDTRKNIPEIPVYETEFAKNKEGKLIVEVWEI